MASVMESNAAVLGQELAWLSQLIDTRLRLYFGMEAPFPSIMDIPVPSLEARNSPYAGFIHLHQLGIPERILLILGLAPFLKPGILDGFFARNTTYDKRFTEFGGLANPGAGFLPTGETALFLLAGDHLEERFTYCRMLMDGHYLVKNKILKLEASQNEPFLNGRLAVSQDYVEYFITGSFKKPSFDEAFPAKLVTTDLEWEEVVHTPYTLEGVLEIKDWMEHGPTLLHGLGLAKRLKPGYKSLFYGPAGTGKTLTATLLGKSTGRDVYKIDLSLIVSKYIGDTEKNLAKVFDQAENRDWILFFDEADALFGNRTEINSANDRFANQEVAYLLQRMEDHNGLVILASNLKDNIDKAFLRRFQSTVHFPMPGADERYRIWQQSFSRELPPAKEVNLRDIAEKYALSGGLMMNVVRYCTLKAMKNKKNTICLADIEYGIKRELHKDGIIFTN
jgi:hypothetical protein